jgi:hypothetical protein
MYYTETVKNITSALENMKGKINSLHDDVLRDKNTLQSLITLKDDYKFLVNADVKDLNGDQIKAKNAILKLVDHLELYMKINKNAIDNLEMLIFQNENEFDNQTKLASNQGNIDLNSLNNANATVTDAIRSLRSKVSTIAKEHAIIDKLLTEFCDAIGYCLFRTKKIGKMVDELIEEKFAKASTYFDAEISKKLKNIEHSNTSALQKYNSSADLIKIEFDKIKTIANASIAKLEKQINALTSQFNDFKDTYKSDYRDTKDNISNLISAYNQL